MGNLDQYKIDLKGMKASSATFEYVLDNSYFENLDAPEVQRGLVNAVVRVKRMSMAFEMDIQVDGTVMVPCDRCLDDMEIEVESADRLVVKFGREYAEEEDNLIIVPEDEGCINVAWFLYELIALAIPMKHVHAPGECNQSMAAKLRKHLRVDASEMDEEDLEFDSDDESSDDEKSTPIDPRWNDLKKILDNN